jgi:TRAP-type mannitol/chloroaromatic compound transport system permease small subunit
MFDKKELGVESLLGLSRLVDGVNSAFGKICDWLILICCCVSAGNASIRYIFSYSSNGWLEIQWQMFGAIVLLGASYTLKMNEHVRVDLVYGSVSDRARLWIDAVGFLFFMLPVTVFLTWLCWPFFTVSFAQSEMSQNAGGLILWPVKAILPLGFAMLTLQGISELIKRVAAITGHVEFNTAYEKPLQ